MNTLSLVTQDDWSAGMFQGSSPERIPPNGAYDIVNGLLDVDEGVIYRRGGSTYETTTGAADPLLGMHYVSLARADERITHDTEGRLLYDSGLGLTAVNGTPATYAVNRDPTYRAHRAAVMAGIFLIPAGSRLVLMWGGDRGTTNYSTGTVAFTEGSATATGTGTTWSTNIAAGSLLVVTSGSTNFVAAVKSVDSNTSVTLAAPWVGASASGLAYTAKASHAVTVTSTGSAGTSGGPQVGVAGGRLFFGWGNRLSFSAIGNPASFAATDYHELPTGARITGLVPVRDMLLVFSDVGTWILRNPSLDLTDASGNPQQALDSGASDVVVWDSPGIVAWRGGLVVPADDNVYLMDGVSTPVPIGNPILDRYRAHVTAGYQLGNAVVEQGHLLLPVVDTRSPGVGLWAPTAIETLVCRLDTRSWSRCTGDSGKVMGFAQRKWFGDLAAALYAASEDREGGHILNCKWFSPSAAYKYEADGSGYAFTVTTRDYSVSSLKALVKKARLWFEGVDAGTDNPTVSLAWAEGPAGSSFTTLSGAAPESTGDTPAKVWPVNAAAKRVRFQIASESPWASLKLKTLDLFVRPKARP